MLFAEKQSYIFYVTNKAKARSRSLVHDFLESKRNNLVRKKGKLSDFLTDKTLFTEKGSDCYYVRIKSLI